MTPATTTAALASGAARTRELVCDFGRWWVGELLNLFPRSVADWLVDNGTRRLVLAPETDAVVLRLVSDRGGTLASHRIGRHEYAPDCIDQFLRSCRQDRAQVAIGLSLPQDLVFRRSFFLPLATRRSLDAVVVQDLVTKTPFQLADVHHVHQARRVGERLAVSQWVVRRTHVAAAARTLGLEPEHVAFIEAADPGGDEGSSALVMIGSASAGGSSWARRVAVGLAASALLLGVATLGTTYQRQQAVLDALEAEVAGAMAQARSVRATLDKLQQDQAAVTRVRAKRGEPGLLAIWEEATRILPADTWLSELRLSETQEHTDVVMMGYSAAAARLIGLIEQSEIFMEASLVGPVAIDPAEGKERFIIQAKLRSPGPSKAASR